MKLTVNVLLVFLSTSLFSTTALAVDDIGVFEMDGNAVEEISDYEDWETLYANGNNNGGSPVVFTSVQHDHGGATIFEGGRKDIQPIEFWRWKTGSVPDKDDITHAYAAAYLCPGTITGECDVGDTVAYFGADRFSNSGDAFLGFWFFRDHISRNPDGTFKGMHMPGDILVLVNFPQGSNAEPEIQAVEWDTDCMKADKDMVPGVSCVAKNLRLLYNGIVCGSEPEDYVCALTNTEDYIPGGGMQPGTIEAPWDYVAKSPDPGCAHPYCLPFESFFEGGINLSVFMEEGADTCFASFMAESRSSSQFTATLKDFVLGEFPLCAVELSKTCGDGEYDEASGMLRVPYSVTIDNTGSATVDEVVATDDLCGHGEAVHTFGPIAAGGSETQTGDCYISADAFDLPMVNSVHAVADGGAVPVFMADTCTPGSDPERCYDACGYNLSPDIGVSKNCWTRLNDSSGQVVVEVFFDGMIENTSDDGLYPVPLDNVEAYDDMAGGPLELTDCAAIPIALETPVWLEPGEVACFAGSYLPASTNSTCPGDANFMDTVTVTSTAAFTGAPVNDAATIDCDLCVPGGCD